MRDGEMGADIPIVFVRTFHARSWGRAEMSRAFRRVQLDASLCLGKRLPVPTGASRGLRAISVREEEATA